MAIEVKQSQNKITQFEEYDKSMLVPKELQDKISFWILKMIFKLGTHNEFINNRNYFHKDYIASFLGLHKYVLMDGEGFTKDEVLDNLRQEYKKLEKRKRFSTSKLLAKNIKQLSKLMNLSIEEEMVIEFIILLNQFEVLENSADMLGNALTTAQGKKILSVILDIPIKIINSMFASDSKFSKSGLISIEKDRNNDLIRKFDIISDQLFDDIMNLDENIIMMIKDIVRKCDDSLLDLEDYTHIKKDVDLMENYLINAISKKQSGVNILLYGLPGTGKIELTKTVAKTIGCELFEISYATESDEPIKDRDRLKAYKIAQTIFSDQKTLLMYDEAEDIFESSRGGFFTPSSRQRDKAWINRMLETNKIPTVWITNNIEAIDSAIVRRFDMCIELPIPNKEKREKIISNYANGKLTNATIKLLAKNEHIAPAVIGSATKVTNILKLNQSDDVMVHLINNTLKAQGYGEIRNDEETLLPNEYNPKFINSDIDLEELVTGIKENPNARICLYGAAGTGKSAYGKYLAESLNKKIILKKGSDLQS